MGVVVESYEKRWGPVVEGTLEMLAEPTDKITYGISTGRVWFPCQALMDDQDNQDVIPPAADEDDEDGCQHGHEVAAMVILWTVERADGFSWTHVSHLPVEIRPATAAEIQQCLGVGWEAMLFNRQANDMLDLDAELDEIFVEGPEA